MTVQTKTDPFDVRQHRQQSVINREDAHSRAVTVLAARDWSPGGGGLNGAPATGTSAGVLAGLRVMTEDAGDGRGREVFEVTG